jgi:hypothetical protein
MSHLAINKKISLWKERQLISQRYIIGLKKVPTENKNTSNTSICIADIETSEIICELLLSRENFTYAFFDGIFYISSKHGIIVSDISGLTYIKFIDKEKHNRTLITHSIKNNEPFIAYVNEDYLIVSEETDRNLRRRRENKITCYSAQDLMCITKVIVPYESAILNLNNINIIDDSYIHNTITNEIVLDYPVCENFTYILKKHDIRERAWCILNKCLYFIEHVENNTILYAYYVYDQDNETPNPRMIMLFKHITVNKLSISQDGRYLLLSALPRYIVIYTRENQIIYETIRNRKPILTTDSRYFLVDAGQGCINVTESPLMNTPRIADELCKYMCRDLNNIVLSYAGLYYLK